MEKKIIKDLYCFQCSLQFDKKSIYDIHLKIMHNYKSREKCFENEIKTEPDEIQLPIESNIYLKNIPEENNDTIKHKISNQEKYKIKIFKCKHCNYSSSKK